MDLPADAASAGPRSRDGLGRGRRMSWDGPHTLDGWPHNLEWAGGLAAHTGWTGPRTLYWACPVTQLRFRRQRTSDCAALTFQQQVSLSQFVLASPTAKRRMIEPLASVLKEGFRKRGERDFGKRRIISKQEKDNNSLAYI